MLLQDHVHEINMDHLMGQINMDEINIQINIAWNKHDHDHEINMDHWHWREKWSK